MRSDTLYYLVIVFLDYIVYQGVGVASKPTNDDNLIVFILAECKARLKSFAFGVFLFIKHISIHCRDPPFYQFENKSKLIGGNKMIKIIKRWIEDNEYKEIQYDTEIKQYYYCFKENTNNKNQIYYDIEVFYKFNLPVIGNIAMYRIAGTTKAFVGSSERIGR